MLGMIENMSFFDVQAYLKERGGPKVRQRWNPTTSSTYPATNVPISSDAACAPESRTSRRAVPWRGSLEHPCARVGRLRPISGRLRTRAPSRPYLLGVVEQLAAQISIQNIKTPKMPKLEILN